MQQTSAKKVCRGGAFYLSTGAFSWETLFLADKHLELYNLYIRDYQDVSIFNLLNPYQRVLIVAIHDYAYVVPCVVTGEVYEFITLFPSRKATRDYVRRRTL